MITLQELLELACKADDTMNKERKSPGTTQSDAFLDAYRARENAMAAAKWLEEAGLTEIEQLGPYGAKPIKRGDTVIIKAGSVITSMHPKYNRQNPKIARRSYKIRVHDVHAGYLISHWHPHKRDSTEVHREQQICWAGDGGYWCYLDTKNVELID